MQLRDYLQRIHWVGDTRPTLETLDGLMRAQNHNVPFENIDIQMGVPLTTDVEAAYEKIVHRNRGGWCYEHNGVLGWALAEIGFEVRRISASVMRQSVGANAHANHLTLIARLPGEDTPWLVDAGFGGSLLHPLPLKKTSAHHSPFDVGLRRLDDGHWQFWENLGKGEITFDFKDAPADERGMAERCHYLQTDEDSSFVKRLVCELRRPDAHLSLRGRVLRETTDEGVSERLLDSADELLAVLKDEFKVDAPQVASLWGRICEQHEAFVAQS